MFYYEKYLDLVSLLLRLFGGKSKEKKLEALQWCVNALKRNSLSCLEYMQRDLDDAHATILHIGVTKWMLKKILQEFCRREIKQLRDLSYPGNQLTIGWVQGLRDHLTTYGWTPSDIGINEEDLKRAPCYFYFRQASHHLNNARHPVRERDTGMDMFFSMLSEVAKQSPDAIDPDLLPATSDQLPRIEVFVDLEIRFMGENLEKGNLSLSDIGTSDEEVGTMLQEYHGRKAKEYLGYLRTDGTASFTLKTLREHLKASGLTLSKIGTTEEKLTVLLHASCKNGATHLLESTRSGSSGLTLDGLEIFLKFMREDLEECGLTLSDVGTSEAEIEELLSKKREASKEFAVCGK